VVGCPESNEASRQPTSGSTDLFVSSVGVVAVWVGGCRGGLSTFPFGCWLLPSSFVAASVGGGTSCSGSRVVRGQRFECGHREGGGGVCRERAALAAGVGARRCFGPAATGSYRTPAQAGRRPSRDGPGRVGARRPGSWLRGRPVDPGTSRHDRHPVNGGGVVEGIGVATLISDASYRHCSPAGS